MENDLRTNLSDHTGASCAGGRLSPRRLALSGLRGALSAPAAQAAKGGALLALAVSLVAALSSPAPSMALAHGLGRSATTSSTAPLLPGETLWNGVPSYLFGNNEPYAWVGNNLDTTPSIQATLKSQHLPLVRVWFEQYSETDGSLEPDSYQELQYKAVSSTGATCFANLLDSNSMAFDLHMVSLFKGRCELYEIGNEPDSDSSMTPQSYLNFWNSFVPQARAIDPNARFGGPATTVPLGYDCSWDSSGNQNCFTEKWLQGTVASGVAPDFVTFHWYTCWDENATDCMARAHTIGTIGDSTIALVNKYYPNKHIPVGLTEWNANAGTPSYQFDDTWMTQYEQASLTALEQSNLSFATQFNLASCSGYGSLDMFNVCTGSSNGSPRPYEGVWAAEVAREMSGGVSAPSPTSPGATPTPSSSPTGGSSATPTPSATSAPSTPTSSTGSSGSSSSSGSPLFSDTFQTATPGGAPLGWTAESGHWTIQQDGTVNGGLPNLALAQGDPSTASQYIVTAGSSSWTDYTVQASVKPGSNDLSQTTDIMARYTDSDNHYSLLFKNNSEWYLGKRSGGTWTTFAQGVYPYSSQFYTLALTVNGSTISGAINGKVVATATDQSLASGQIGFLTSAESELDNVVVSAPGSTTSAPGSAPGSTPVPSTPTPTATTAACAEVVNGVLTVGTCTGTFAAGSGGSGTICVEQANGVMTQGRCSGTFSANS